MPTPDRDADASDQSAPAHRPAQDQRLPADEASTGENVSTPDPDGERIAEAGNAYMGREMDERLQENPRELDGDRAEKEEGEETGQ